MSSPQPFSGSFQQSNFESQDLNCLKDSDNSALRALHRAADRVTKANLPFAPNFLIVEGSMIPSVAIGHKWVEGTPFSHQEGYLQYSTFFTQTSPDTLLHVRSSTEITNQVAMSSNAQTQKSGADAASTANNEMKEQTPNTTAPKKKISLSDYAARKKDGVGRSAASTPNHQAQPHSDDLRKETLKKELGTNAQPVPADVDGSVANGINSQPQPSSNANTTTNKDNKKRASEVAIGELQTVNGAESAHPAKKQRTTPPLSPKGKGFVPPEFSPKTPSTQVSKPSNKSSEPKSIEKAQALTPINAVTIIKGDSPNLKADPKISHADSQTIAENAVVGSTAKALRRWLPNSPSPPPRLFPRDGETALSKRKVPSDSTQGDASSKKLKIDSSSTVTSTSVDERKATSASKIENISKSSTANKALDKSKTPKFEIVLNDVQALRASRSKELKGANSSTENSLVEIEAARLLKTATILYNKMNDDAKNRPLLAIEALLYVMKAFVEETKTCEDTAYLLRLWKSALPLCKEVREICKGLKELEGLVSVLSMAYRAQYAATMADTEAVASSKELILCPAVCQNIRKSQQLVEDWEQLLPREVLQERYGKAWKQFILMMPFSREAASKAVKFGVLFLKDWRSYNWTWKTEFLNEKL